MVKWREVVIEGELPSREEFSAMNRQPLNYNPALAEEMILHLSPFASMEGGLGEPSEFQRLLDVTWGMTASAEMQDGDTREDTGAWTPPRSVAKRQQDERVLGGVARKYLEDAVTSPVATLGAIDDAKLLAWRVAPGTETLIDDLLADHAARIASLKTAAKLAAAEVKEEPQTAEEPQTLPGQRRWLRLRRMIRFAAQCFTEEAPRRVALGPSQYSQLIS